MLMSENIIVEYNNICVELPLLYIFCNFIYVLVYHTIHTLSTIYANLVAFCSKKCHFFAKNVDASIKCEKMYIYKKTKKRKRVSLCKTFVKTQQK